VLPIVRAEANGSAGVPSASVHVVRRLARRLKRIVLCQRSVICESLRST
jgi:hypothetical protein